MATSIINNTYKIKNPTKENLLKLGFKYNVIVESYVYYFTITKYKNVPTLRGCISVNEGIGRIKIDVYKANGEGYYSPFYGVIYGRYDTILEEINQNILKEFAKLGIRKAKK